MAMNAVSDVVGDYSGLSRNVLDYSLIMQRLLNDAKKPGFSVHSWAPLAELVDVKHFERIGNFKEVMHWNDYVNFLTPWAMSSEWDCSFKRITEHGNLVFLELEERSNVGGHSSVVNSASVYEFNNAGKLRHLDIYLQMALPNSDMLKSYEGVKIFT